MKEYAIKENNLKSCDNEQILTKMNSLSNLNYKILFKKRKIIIIFHGNLKSSNIFIVDNGDIKIADYGFDQILNYEKKDL